MSRLNAFIELDREQIHAMLLDYPLEDLGEPRPLVAGIINTNYQFRASAREYLLRLYPPERSAEALRFELSTLSHLAAGGFPCPRVTSDRQGRQFRWSEAHGRYYVVLEFIPGETLARAAIGLGVARQIGRLFADMQRILTGFVPEGSKPSADLEFIAELGARTLARLEALPGEGPAVAQRLREVWTQSHARLSAVSDAQVGVVHADLYFDNIIVVDDQITGVIDFDDSYWGLFVIDLAVVLMEFGFVEAEILDFTLGEQLLREVFTHRPEARAEAHLLYDSMVCACYKYLGYTAGLSDYAGAKLLSNEYIARIEYLAHRSTRAQVEAMIRAALEASS